MSSKSTIFLTKDNEHCFKEGNKPHYNGKEFIGDSIFLEMDKKNIVIDTNNDFDLIIEILPGSELYERISKMKG